MADRLTEQARDEALRLIAELDAADMASGAKREAAADFCLHAPRLVRGLLKECAVLRAQLQASEAAREKAERERDKWLDAFNKSEQFQSGPTKRAEQAEAALRASEDARARLEHALDHVAKFSALKAGQFASQAFGDSRVEDAANVLEDVALMLRDALAIVPDTGATP